jgi:hypothetical protein
MNYTYYQLSKMTVAQLREIAQGVESEELKGFSTMHKEKLLPLLCKALHIEVPHHHVEGIDKTGIKQQIRALKAKRDAAIQRKETAELQTIRRQIHNLKRELRKHMV